MDPKLVEVVGKLVNRASSEEPAEAAAAAKGAVGRLERSGATFPEFLREADPGILFQAGLLRVAERWAASRGDSLSEPAKRELLSELVARISAMYSGGPDPAEREAELRRREEDLRRREEALAAERSGAGTGTRAPGTAADGKNGKQSRFSFSPARFFKFPAGFPPSAATVRRVRKPALAACVDGAGFGVAAVLALSFLSASGAFPAGAMEGVPVSVLLAVLAVAGAAASFARRVFPGMRRTF